MYIKPVSLSNFFVENWCTCYHSMFIPVYNIPLMFGVFMSQWYNFFYM